MRKTLLVAMTALAGQLFEAVQVQVLGVELQQVPGFTPDQLGVTSSLRPTCWPGSAL